MQMRAHAPRIIINLSRNVPRAALENFQITRRGSVVEKCAPANFPLD